jgi:hypothetical protein
VALVGAVGYFVPIAGPLLLVLAALALPLAASDEVARRPARRRKGAGPSLPDAGSSDEE